MVSQQSDRCVVTHPIGPRAYTAQMNSDPVSIRSAKLEDLTVLAELNSVVQDLHVANRPDVFRPTERKAVIEWFRGCLERPNINIFIAEREESAVGYLIAVVHERSDAVFSRAGRAIEIDQIVVRPSSQRRGIGRALIRQVFYEAKANGIPKVTVKSWAFNLEAHATFVESGFTPEIIEFSRTVPE